MVNMVKGFESVIWQQLRVIDRVEFIDQGRYRVGFGAVVNEPAGHIRVQAFWNCVEEILCE